MPDRKKSLWTIIPALLFIVFAGACDKAVTTGPSSDPSGALVQYTGCKGASTADGPRILSTSSPAQECLSYIYNGQTLQLIHVNAAFNCCLDDIVCEISFAGGTIVIKEEGILANGQGCFCDCLYDIDMEIQNLEPSIYSISLPSFEKPILLDLRRPASGIHCEDRDRYPWI